jgi:uncharacterized protein (DUF1684 family)
MAESDVSAPTWLDLYDYRERTARLYRERDAAQRAGEADEAVWRRWRAGRDALFAAHPQSALDAVARRDFSGLRYFPYNPTLRIEARLAPAREDATSTLPGSAAMQAAEASHTSTLFRRAGQLSFTLDGAPARLIVYWIDVYGGGLFLPFRDATSGSETYGGGRYLCDTIKGSAFLRLDADTPDDGDQTLGYAGGRILLDFNYAYNPSCAYDTRWACPLAPAENRLPVAIRAGELAFCT